VAAATAPGRHATAFSRRGHRARSPWPPDHGQQTRTRAACRKARGSML